MWLSINSTIGGLVGKLAQLLKTKDEKTDMPTCMLILVHADVTNFSKKLCAQCSLCAAI